MPSRGNIAGVTEPETASGTRSVSRKSKSRRRKGATRPSLPTLAPPPRAPRSDTPTREFVRWLVPGLIALATVAAFLPALHNQFVDWDDKENFLDNPHYRGLGWPHLRWMWTTVHMGHWIPLTWMTLGLDYVVWGLKPIGYHLTSLLLHAANAVVFYFVARRIVRAARSGSVERSPLSLTAAAAVAALVFALHPLRVESVAWATERRDVLSGLFYLLTLLAYLRACERGRRWRGEYWMAVGLFACALLSKSMAVSLPVVLLILDVYPLRRLAGAMGWWGSSARRVYLEKMPFLVLAIAASAVAFLAVGRLGNLSSLDRLSTLERLTISAFSLSVYLWKMIVPLNLSPLYELPAAVNPWAPSFLLSYGAVLAVSAVAWVVRGRAPGVLAAWLAFAAILFPVLGIFQNGPQIAADRYTYLASLVLALWAGAVLLCGWPRHPAMLGAAAGGVVLALAGVTWTQVHVWRDSTTLWRHALAIDSHSSVGQFNLGNVLRDQGKPAEAIERFRQALAVNPAYAEAHYNLGIVLARQGNAAEAIGHYREALRLKPDYPDAHNNWGLALRDQGNTTEAAEHFHHALRVRPTYAEAHNNLGVVLGQQGKLAEAMHHFQLALEINPHYAAAHYNWGVALAQQGMLAEAVAHFQLALKIKPDYAAAHFRLGAILTQQGKPAQAAEHYLRAIQIKPDRADLPSGLPQVLSGLDGATKPAEPGAPSSGEGRRAK